jgi:hypothetical protein
MLLEVGHSGIAHDTKASERVEEHPGTGGGRCGMCRAGAEQRCEVRGGGMRRPCSAATLEVQCGRERSRWVGEK